MSRSIRYPGAAPHSLILLDSPGLQGAAPSSSTSSSTSSFTSSTTTEPHASGFSELCYNYLQVGIHREPVTLTPPPQERLHLVTSNPPTGLGQQVTSGYSASPLWLSLPLTLTWSTGLFSLRSPGAGQQHDEPGGSHLCRGEGREPPPQVVQDLRATSWILHPVTYVSQGEQEEPASREPARATGSTPQVHQVTTH